MQKKCIKLILLRKIQILFKSYNGANGYLFVNGTEIIKFKAKDSEILAYSLCLDWTNNNIKKQDLMVTFMILVLTIMPLQFLI